MKIDIDEIGIGYVGYAKSLLLSESNSITLYDIDEGKVESINKGEALFNDELCIDYANKNKSLRLNIDKMNFKSHKTDFLSKLLKLDEGEYLENCFQLGNFLN